MLLRVRRRGNTYFPENHDETFDALVDKFNEAEG